MDRLFGKLPAVLDLRVPLLHDVTAAKPLPQQVNWRAKLPDGGIPLLGNGGADGCGCCTIATPMHYMQLGSLYRDDPTPLEPTTAECVGEYARQSGYNLATGAHDTGLVMMGQGGVIENWTKRGIMCGGVLNKLTSAVRVDHTNMDRLKSALTYGPVLLGANLTQGDVDADFMWNAIGKGVGGHEFLGVGYEVISTGKTYFDVITWTGGYRFPDDWTGLDEAVMALDTVWFDAHNINPAGIDWEAVQIGMQELAA